MDVENIENNIIKVNSLNLDSQKEFIKMLKLVKYKNILKVLDSNLEIKYEQNKLYEAIVFKNESSSELYKYIISKNGNKQYNEPFDNYLLPVGSVVKLEGGNTLLIVSRDVEETSSREFYQGCDYIKGISSKQYNFKHQDVEQILSLPYEGEESIQETIRLKNRLDNM